VQEKVGKQRRRGRGGDIKEEGRNWEAERGREGPQVIF